MKTKLLSLVILTMISIFLTSCEKEAEAPVISIHELGEGETHGNDYTATIGGDLHMDIEVVAEGKIETIQVIIHPEGEHGGGDQEEWEIDTTYTKFSGLKNTEFHEHIEIDENAEAGDYHFDFIVTDQEGNQSRAEAELEIKEP
jgi:hypothetical protein